MIQRKYKVNENYFDKIDTVNKAYFLGFLYADGYIFEGKENTNTKNKKSQTLNLTLQKEDTYILERLRLDIQSERPLTYIKSQDKYRLCICSKQLVQRLVELGCGQAKTFKLEFPTEEQVPSYLIRHFIRGYFDGDGSLYFKEGIKNKLSVQCQFSIISSHAFIKSVNEFLIKELNINSYIRKANTKNIHRHVYRLQVSGRNNVCKLMEFLYLDKEYFFLSRKFEKYLDIKNYTKLKCGRKQQPNLLRSLVTI